MARATAQPEKKPIYENEVLVYEKEKMSFFFSFIQKRTLKDELSTKEVCDSVFLPLSFRP